MAQGAAGMATNIPKASGSDKSRWFFALDDGRLVKQSAISRAKMTMSMSVQGMTIQQQMEITTKTSIGLAADKTRT